MAYPKAPRPWMKYVASLYKDGYSVLDMGNAFAVEKRGKVVVKERGKIDKVLEAAVSKGLGDTDEAPGAAKAASMELVARELLLAAKDIVAAKTWMLEAHQTHMGTWWVELKDEHGKMVRKFKQSTRKKVETRAIALVKSLPEAKGVKRLETLYFPYGGEGDPDEGLIRLGASRTAAEEMDYTAEQEEAFEDTEEALNRAFGTIGNLVAVDSREHHYVYQTDLETEAKSLLKDAQNFAKKTGDAKFVKDVADIVKGMRKLMPPIKAKYLAYERAKARWLAAKSQWSDTGYKWKGSGTSKMYAQFENMLKKYGWD
jgi:hypothetical protein